MDAEKIFCSVDGKNGELSHKLRTVADLIRHIKTKEKESPANYSIFLGAGASVTSEIRTASQLIDEWALELYERFNHTKAESVDIAKKFFENNHSSWYSPENPYSSLFEKKFDLPIQRRRFVEQEVDSKYPSIGYAYLTSLVDKNYFNTIFTTNFDDLINEAFYLFSNTRPILCAHDSSIHSISITSKRPKIVKLHGDYLFDDIKSTLRETESLEQNTKEKFVEFCKEYGLIVVGYSGSDRSIMDVLELLARQENYLKNGIYWCLRRTDNVCHTLRNLIWKDKVYPVLIDGFDELFAEIHALTECGELKLNSSKKQSKLHQTIQNITNDKYSLINNPIIAHEIQSIRNDGDSKDISEFVKQMASANESSKLKLTDVRNLLEIGTLIESGDFQKAEETCSMYYETTASPEEKAVYIEKYIDIYQKTGLEHKVSFWCDKLIEIDPNNIEYHLKKARSISSKNERVEYLKEALNRFQYSISLLNSICSNSIRLMRSNESDQSHKYLIDVKSHSERSLTIDPSLDNSAWSLKMEALTVQYFQCQQKTEKEDIQNEISELVKAARSRHPEHPRALELAEEQLKLSCTLPDLRGILDFLFELKEKSSITMQRKVNSMTARCFDHIYELEDKSELTSTLEKFIEDQTDIKDNIPSVSLCKIKYWFTLGNKNQAAIDELEKLLNRKKIGAHIGSILKMPMDFDIPTLNKLQEKLEADKHDLNLDYYYETLSEIYTFKKDYDTAAQHLETAFREGISLKTYLSSKSYILLLSESYVAILNLASRYSTELKTFDAETITINVQCAAQKMASNQFNELALRNLIAQSSSDGVKICAHALLGHEQDAKRLIKKTLNKDPSLLFQYKRWPALRREYITEELENQRVA